MIKVMIADDNPAFCKSCFEFLTKDKDIKVVSYVYDGEEAINKYLSIQPDVLLLDLNMPKATGFEVINKLSTYPKEKEKCNIIVMTGESAMQVSLYNMSKVYSILPKPVGFEVVLDKVKELAHENEEIDISELKRILLELRINIYSNSYRYLIALVTLAYNQPSLLRNIKDLYIQVAKQFHVSPYTIKWSIRNISDILNRTTSIDKICDIFNLSYRPDSISPKFFITLIIEYLKNSRN